MKRRKRLFARKRIDTAMIYFVARNLRYNFRFSQHFEREDYNRNRRSKKVHVNYFRPNDFFVALKGFIVARKRYKMENFGVRIRKEHRILPLTHLYAVI